MPRKRKNELFIAILRTLFNKGAFEGTGRSVAKYDLVNLLKQDEELNFSQSVFTNTLQYRSDCIKVIKRNLYMMKKGLDHLFIPQKNDTAFLYAVRENQGKKIKPKIISDIINQIINDEDRYFSPDRVQPMAVKMQKKNYIAFRKYGRHKDTLYEYFLMPEGRDFLFDQLNMDLHKSRIPEQIIDNHLKPWLTFD